MSEQVDCFRAKSLKALAKDLAGPLGRALSPVEFIRYKRKPTLRALVNGKLVEPDRIRKGPQ